MTCTAAMDRQLLVAWQEQDARRSCCKEGSLDSGGSSGAGGGRAGMAHSGRACCSGASACASACSGDATVACKHWLE